MFDEMVKNTKVVRITNLPTGFSNGVSEKNQLIVQQRPPRRQGSAAVSA